MRDALFVQPNLTGTRPQVGMTEKGGAAPFQQRQRRGWKRKDEPGADAGPAERGPAGKRAKTEKGKKGDKKGDSSSKIVSALR